MDFRVVAERKILFETLQDPFAFLIHKPQGFLHLSSPLLLIDLN
jgi:hypothetical protein